MGAKCIVQWLLILHPPSRTPKHRSPTARKLPNHTTVTSRRTTKAIALRWLAPHCYGNSLPRNEDEANIRSLSHNYGGPRSLRPFALLSSTSLQHCWHYNHNTYCQSSVIYSIFPSFERPTKHNLSGHNGSLITYTTKIRTSICQSRPPNYMHGPFPSWTIAVTTYPSSNQLHPYFSSIKPSTQAHRYHWCLMVYATNVMMLAAINSLHVYKLVILYRNRKHVWILKQ